MVAITAAAAGTAPAGVAAASVSSQRSEAAAVLHRIEVLNWRRSHLATVERNAQTRRRELRLSIQGIRGAMASQQQALRDEQERSPRLIVGDYKSGTTDNAAYVLASGSFADLVQRVDEVNRLNSRRPTCCARSTAHSRSWAGSGARSATGTPRPRSSDRLRSARRGLDRAIAARQAVLAGLDAQIQGEIAREQQRRSRLAGGTARPAGPGAGAGQGGFTGEASWYGPGFAGHRTADGEIFDPTKLTGGQPVAAVQHHAAGHRPRRPAARSWCASTTAARSAAACSTSPHTPPRSSGSAGGPRCRRRSVSGRALER